MDDKFLNYYNQELLYLRELGEEFAVKHPKIASRLQMSEEGVGDAHTEHIIQSFAFLTARLSQKLDDDFAEISTALLEKMYPHYLSPIPSMSTVQFKASEGLTSVYPLPRHTALDTSAEHGEVCQFITAYDVDVLPLNVVDVAFLSLPFDIPTHLVDADKVAGAIQLQLQTEKGLDLATLGLSQLRFFIGDAEASIVSALYELLSNQLIAIGVSNTIQNKDISLLPSHDWSPSGFERNQNLLIYPDNTLASYQLLTEFFIYPEKFLYFDCTGLKTLNKPLTGTTLVITLFVKEYDAMIAKRLTKHAFKLGCTPMVNLFKYQAEPIQLSHTQAEYTLVADKRNREGIEVYSIIDMVAIDSEGEPIALLPLYGSHQVYLDESLAKCYWSARRVKTEDLTTSSYLKIAFSDINYHYLMDKDYIVHASIWCSNGQLPEKLPFSKNEPKLCLLEANDAIASIHCLKLMTRSQKLCVVKESRWRLVSHLSASSAGVLFNQKDATEFKSWLALYSQTHEQAPVIINGITQLKSSHTYRRCSSIGPGFYQGTQIDIEFDRTKYADHHLFLFGAVLDRFFARLANLNSFTQLRIHTQQKGLLCTFPPRSGTQILC